MRRTGTALLTMLVVIGMTTGGAALARSRPRYQAHHHTRAASYGAWGISSQGSASWVVKATVTQTNGETASWNERSSSQWHFAVPSGQTAGAGLGVTYPAPCLQVKALPCGQSGAIGVGDGPSTMTFDIDDTLTQPSGPSQSLICAGKLESRDQGDVTVTPRFIRDRNSYELGITLEPLQAVEALRDPRCPGTNPDGITTLGDWDPPNLPPGGHVSGGFWTAASVTIPAKTFATYSEIVIPISLSSRFRVPANCGIDPRTAYATTHCSADGSWSGLVVLHRLYSS